MYNQNITIYKETMNILIGLMQNEQNLFTNANDALSKTIAGAKVESYQTAIDVFQFQISRISYG